MKYPNGGIISAERANYRAKPSSKGSEMISKRSPYIFMCFDVLKPRSSDPSAVLGWGTAMMLGFESMSWLGPGVVDRNVNFRKSHVAS